MNYWSERSKEKKTKTTITQENIIFMVFTKKKNCAIFNFNIRDNTPFVK